MSDDAQIFGDYLDGSRAALRRVEVVLLADRLRLGLPEGGHLDWPLADLRALPDQASRDEAVLHPADDPVARLMLRDEALIARIRAAAPRLSARPPVENKGKIAAWAAGAVASVALIIFVLVPLMASQLATFLPPEGEKALGDATFEQIRAALADGPDLPVTLCEAPAGLAAMEKMRARLAAADDDLPYPVTITVLDHDLVNAFALPGGRVVFFRGMLEEAENPDEIAAILAHEIGHVVRRDPTTGALRVAGSMGVLGLLFGDFAGGTVVLLLANHLIDMQYSQAAETGSDDYAHALLTEAGLPPAALGSIFARLKDKYGDAEGFAAHLSSHPQMAERIAAAEAAQARAANLGMPSLNAAEWRALREICGPSEPEKPAPASGRSRLGRG